MKYIRTKDGIKKVETIADVQTKVIYKNNLVAQADTIEELCDEFVFVVSDKIHKLILGEHSYKDCVEEAIKHKNRTIYGAIWCEWGLKFVAKLNNKGEMELI